MADRPPLFRRSRREPPAEPSADRSEVPTLLGGGPAADRPPTEGPDAATPGRSGPRWPEPGPSGGYGPLPGWPEPGPSGSPGRLPGRPEPGPSGEFGPLPGWPEPGRPEPGRSASGWSEPAWSAGSDGRRFVGRHGGGTWPDGPESAAHPGRPGPAAHPDHPQSAGGPNVPSAPTARPGSPGAPDRYGYPGPQSAPAPEQEQRGTSGPGTAPPGSRRARRLAEAAAQAGTAPAAPLTAGPAPSSGDTPPPGTPPPSGRGTAPGTDAADLTPYLRPFPVMPPAPGPSSAPDPDPFPVRPQRPGPDRADPHRVDPHRVDPHRVDPDRADPHRVGSDRPDPFPFPGGTGPGGTDPTRPDRTRGSEPGADDPFAPGPALTADPLSGPVRTGHPDGTGEPTRRGGVLLPLTAPLLLAWSLTALVDLSGPRTLVGLLAAVAAVSPAAAVVAIPVTTFALRGRRPVTAGLAIVAGLLPWVFALPYALPADPPKGRTTAVRVLVVNAHEGQARPQDVVAAVRDQGIDLLVITELTGLMAHRLTEAGVDGPLVARWVEVPPLGSSTVPPASGLGIWSRFPMSDFTAVPGTRWPAVRARLDTGHGMLTVVAGHAVPPTVSTAGSWATDLAALHTAGRVPGPVTVLGGLNGTPWNAQFRAAASAGLHDAADVLGRGVRPTWPSWLGVPLLPLDHALVGGGVGVGSLGVATIGGTDHRGLLVTLLVPGT